MEDSKKLRKRGKCEGGAEIKHFALFLSFYISHLRAKNIEISKISC